MHYNHNALVQPLLSRLIASFTFCLLSTSLDLIVIGSVSPYFFTVNIRKDELESCAILGTIYARLFRISLYLPSVSMRFICLRYVYSINCLEMLSRPLNRILCIRSIVSIRAGLNVELVGQRSDVALVSITDPSQGDIPSEVRFYSCSLLFACYFGGFFAAYSTENDRKVDCCPCHRELVKRKFS